MFNQVLFPLPFLSLLHFHFNGFLGKCTGIHNIHESTEVSKAGEALLVQICHCFFVVFNLADFTYLFFQLWISVLIFIYFFLYLHTIFKIYFIDCAIAGSPRSPLCTPPPGTLPPVHIPLLLFISMGHTYKSCLPSTFPLLFLCSLCLLSTYHLYNRHNCPHYFSLLLQYSCLHFPPTTIPHHIVMLKAEYSEINVCMITWLGLSHMKKVPQYKRTDCHGVCRVYCSHPGEAFACWMETRTRISAYWFVKN